MIGWNIIRKISTVTAGGAAIWYFNKHEIKTVFNATKTPWDYNWDQRDLNESQVTSKIVKRSADDNTDVIEKKSTAKRHLILIRHGQYNIDGAKDDERHLTPLGRIQAEITGERLRKLEFPFTDVVISTMRRAQETGKIILEQLPACKTLQITHEPLIEEGAPIAPEPKMGGFRPEFYVRINIIFDVK